MPPLGFRSAVMSDWLSFAWERPKVLPTCVGQAMRQKQPRNRRMAVRSHSPALSTE